MQALIQKKWKDELEKYISAIVQNYGHKLIVIGSMPDHIHIFIGYKLTQTIPKLIEEIKTSSNAWIKEKKLSRFKFDWQNGFEAFTHSHSQIDSVTKYVLRQQAHHEKKSFREEYIEILNNLQINIETNTCLIFLTMYVDGNDITVLCTLVNP